MKFKHYRLSILLSLLLLTITSPANELENITLPDMGDSSGTLISPAEEQELGKAFFRSLHSQLEINQDVDIQLYIQTIGQRLVLNSDLPRGEFHFFVVLDHQINAFAGPGGYIGINSGLILMSESESELASVMAHEIAHVTQRHLYRAFEAASLMSLPTAAATLAAILIGTQSPAMGLAALTAIQAGSVQQQINFTRSNEQEADRVGMKTLVNSQYDPRSMPLFFERLQQSSRYYGQNIPEFLRTHPVTVSRISDTRGRAEKYPYRHYPNSYDYSLTKAKLRVITAKNFEDVLNFFKIREKQGTQQQRAIASYGVGLIYLERKQFAQAAITFQQLTARFPRQRQYVTALARTKIEQRHYTQALKLYRQALQDFPSNAAIKVEYVQILLKVGKPEQARKVLMSLTPQQKQHALYYKLLAQTHGVLNHQAESHRYMAEYLYAMGNTKQAMRQLRLARKSPDINFYISAILEDRMRFFSEEETLRKQGK